MEDAHRKVDDIINNGYDEFDKENYSDAITHFINAWEAVPEPRDQWDVGTSLWVTIFRSYNRMQDHQNALQALKKAQSCYRGAAEHFNKAWDLSEGRAFQGEDPRYVKFARGK